METNPLNTTFTVPWQKEKIVVKTPEKDKVIPIKKLNMLELLKNAPPVLEKYKAGVYRNKLRKSNIKNGSSLLGIFTFGLMPDGGAENVHIVRAVIRDYNAYMYQQKNKVNTEGFKVN